MAKLEGEYVTKLGNGYNSHVLLKINHKVEDVKLPA